MSPLETQFLFSNPDLVRPLAPWCVRLGKLELLLLLICQPWVAGAGLRRAEMQRQLTRLAASMPLGPVYFQRVKRAVERLQQSHSLSGSGGGRTRRFRVTPEGFAALILNLQVLHSDPTLDGSEFELKRSLVVLWNTVLELVQQLPSAWQLDLEVEQFFDAVEQLKIWGEPVVTDERLAAALSVLKLIERQRQHVLRLRDRARERLQGLEPALPAPKTQGWQGFEDGDLSDSGRLLARHPEAAALIRGLAAHSLPRLDLEACLLRYQAYLDYLGELASLYTRRLQVIDLDSFRRLMSSRN